MKNYLIALGFLCFIACNTEKEPTTIEQKPQSAVIDPDYDPEAKLKELGIELEWKGENEHEKGIEKNTGKEIIIVDLRYHYIARWFKKRVYFLL